MRRFNKDNTSNENEQSIQKSIVEEGLSNKAQLAEEILVDTQSENIDKKTTRRVFEIIQDEETDKSRSRVRQTGNSTRRASHARKGNSASMWLKKSLFVVGNIRFSRLVVSSILFLVIVLASSTIVLATNENLFTKQMPVDNNELILAKNTVYIRDGEDVVLYQAYFGTVSSMLKNNNIQLNDNDKIYPSLDTSIYNRMQIVINRALEVTVKSREDEHTIVLYDGTVADALLEANVEYVEGDLVEPSSEKKVSDGMIITHNIVEKKMVTEETVIEYETEYGETATVLKGMYAIPQKGKDGLAEVTYEVTYINGVEESRQVIKENMITEPVKKVILNGTGLSRQGSDDGEDTSIDVENPDDQETNPAVPGTTSTYVEKLVAHVTAYTHTGSTTATGTWPRSTRTLENPGSCAVVPGTFPYGSLIYVPGYGYCIAEDTGGFRHDPDRWNQIDVFMNTVDECIQWGRKREWTVYVIRYGY